MVSYHYVSEEFHKGVLRIMNMMLFAYILPLWMQLIYMGEAAGGADAGRIVIWSVSLHPVTVALLQENLIMVAYVAAVELVQRHVRNFWIYCGAHAACIVLVWFMTQVSAGCIPRLIVCVLFIICAFYARIHETHMGYPSVGWLAVGILMVLTASQTELQDMQTMGYVTEIVSAALCVLYYNAASLEHALEHTKGAGRVPYDRLRQTNIVLMFIWMAAATVVIVAIIFSGLGNSIVELLGQGLLWGVRQLVRFGIFLLGLLPRSGEVYQSTAGMVEQFEMGEMDPIAAILMIILMAIWETLIVLQRIIAFLGIIWLIVQFCRWIYHVFDAAGLEERQTFTWHHVAENIAGISQRTIRGLSALDPTPAARIRRAYIQFIRHGTGYREIRQSMTPEELMTISVNIADYEAVTDENAENMELIQDRLARILELYELARYMPKRCTLQNVNEMQRLVREVRMEMDRWM